MACILERLRGIDVRSRAGIPSEEHSRSALDEFAQSGAAFACSHPKLENVYYRAIHDLTQCIVPSPNGSPMLIEGANFIGLWLESTGTISTEVLSRFCPRAAQSSFCQFADYRREDGLLPYKVTPDGPAYRQIQTVTPLARSVWNHYRRNGDREFLEKMYRAMAANDNWLAKYRDTRGTGCVEAFGTFDTGHDASPRFWHCPDVPFGSDPTQCDPDSPILPFLAPDITANVYCQRKYLGLMADELGITGEDWESKAQKSLNSLMEHCWDSEDRFFYDRDKHGRFVKVQGDNLLRVFECEVGDGALFEDALRRYLLNTRKFFSRYPMTTIAMDDPRFFQDTVYNTWAGQVSFLGNIRIPHAFEYHGRFVELSWIFHPLITALSRFERFAMGLSPWVGREGYMENYTPTMLFLLDALERTCGIYPTEDGRLWFTALIPRGIDYGQLVAEETGYRRRVDGAVFELINSCGASCVYQDGELLYRFPEGIRLITDRSGQLEGIIGMSIRAIKGEVECRGKKKPFTVQGNEILNLTGGDFISVSSPGVVPPSYSSSG
ncbi:MAG: hypothetical protein FWH00_02520 [Oscillospiraceae bacterium]|nr:hypothetical protein [Oscillospiraceae bacterium]